MSVSHYLEKYACEPLSEDRSTYELIITIPAYRELHIKETLYSLLACTPAPANTAIFVLLNYSGALDADFHHFQHQGLQDQFSHAALPIHIFLEELNTKKAGVGLARKMLMDQAARQLNDDGIIVCLDADCTVASNYLQSIQEYFTQHPRAEGTAIHYEHPLDAENAKAILEYELHLRYYVECQRWLKLPYAYHTVGSSMAVRNRTYCKTGGMNQRKAGEDFYFLQKVIPHGFGTIASTTVYPSPRISERVPFGTGRAMAEFSDQLDSYSPVSVQVIKLWLDECRNKWNQAYKELLLPRELTPILESFGFEQEWVRIGKLSRTYEPWKRQFFAWFDGFRLMKLLHALRDRNYPNVPVTEAAEWLLHTTEIPHESGPENVLWKYRELEKLQRQQV